MLKYHNIFLLTLFGIMFFQMLGFGIFLKKSKISMAGLPPVHPALFKTAKAAMMLCWVALFIQASGLYDLTFFNNSHWPTIIAVAFFGIGCILQFISYINLGRNLKFGIPDKEEQRSSLLKINGIYRFSRNPMYVGFFFMTVAACLYVLNPLIWALALFSLTVHHVIVLKEEIFLKERFGDKWEAYTKKVNRYF